MRILRNSSGFAYVLLFIAGFAVSPQCGSIKSTEFDACMLENTSRFGVQAFLYGLSVLAFLFFLGNLWSQVRHSDKSISSSQILMVVGGTLWAALWLIGLGLTAAAVDPVDFQFNAAGARSAFFLTNALLLSEASGILFLPLALFLIATSSTIKQISTLPGWLGNASLGLALLFIGASSLQLIFEAWFVMPMYLLFMIWVVAANIVMFREAA